MLKNDWKVKKKWWKKYEMSNMWLLYYFLHWEFKSIKKKIECLFVKKCMLNILKTFGMIGCEPLKCSFSCEWKAEEIRWKTKCG